MAITKKALAEVERTIEEMDLEELTALKAGIDERVESLRQEARDEFVKSMKEKAIQLGLDLNDLAPSLGIARAAPARGGNGKGGGTVVAKYRNPKNASDTWSGRGRRPRWLTAAMADKGLDETDPVPAEYHV